MTTARDVVAAAEAVAAVEFARAPDSNYAPALQRIAAAMSADHSVARDARLAFLEFAFPDERELDAPVSVSTGSTGFAGSTEFAGWTGRVDAASDSSESSSAPGNTVGIAWRDDDVFGTRLHLLLRLFPFAAPGPVSLGDGGGERLEDESSRRRFGNGYGSAFAAGALARDARGARCVGGFARRSLARRTSRTSPRFDRTRSYTRLFLPYLDVGVGTVPEYPGEPFVAAVGTVPKRTSRSRLAEAARAAVDARLSRTSRVRIQPRTDRCGGRVRGERLGGGARAARAAAATLVDWCRSRRSSITPPDPATRARRR